MLVQRNETKQKIRYLLLVIAYFSVMIITGVFGGGVAQIILTIIVAILTVILIYYGYGLKGSFSNANAIEQKRLESLATTDSIKWVCFFTTILIISYWLAALV
jgi:hypothetical protein